MKRILTAGLCALALVASGAFAQSRNDSSAAQSKYDSTDVGSGNSANWGVGAG